MSNHFWTLPIVGALLGYATNWLAVRMLFRPRRPVRVLWWTLHGLIPRRKDRLAQEVAEAVEGQLFNGDDIEKALQDERVINSVGAEIEQHVREYVKEKLHLLPPAVGGLLYNHPTRMNDLIRALTVQILAALPTVAQSLTTNLKQSLDIKATVAARMAALDDEELEATIFMIAERELRAIEYWGLFIGAAVGALQWLVLYLVGRAGG
jgi:uncharacterized membrane protein YheB (UPF0754 family)